MQVGVVAVAGPDRARSAGRRCRRPRSRPDRSRPRGSAPATTSARACPRTAEPASSSPSRRRERFEPDQAAVLFGDHRPRRALALVGREEQVAGSGAGLGLRRDPHRRGRQRRRRAVVLHRLGVARVQRELLLADRRLVGDREARADGRAAGRARAPSPSRRARNGWLGHEALAGARRVGAQRRPMCGAAARARHAHVGDLSCRRAPRKLICVARRGVRRARLRRDSRRAPVAAGADRSAQRGRGRAAWRRRTRQRRRRSSSAAERTARPSRSAAHAMRPPR